MDPRLQTLVSRLQRSRFADLAGSEARATIRVSAGLLNEAAATFAARGAAIRDLTIRPRAANHIDISLKLARPAFLPSLTITLAIERQPQFPANPELVLRLTGAGGMMRLLGPAVSSFGALPPGIRLDGDHVFVDLSVVLREHGQGDLLDYVEQLQVMSEEGGLIVLAQLRVR